MSKRPAIDSEARYPVDHLEVRLGAFDAAKVVNISGGGLAVETEKYLRVGKSYPLRLKSPSGRVRLDATVVWSRLIRTVPGESVQVRPVYMAGLSFISLSGEQNQQLEELIVREVNARGSEVGPDDVASA